MYQYLGERTERHEYESFWTLTSQVVGMRYTSPECRAVRSIFPKKDNTLASIAINEYFGTAKNGVNFALHRFPMSKRKINGGTTCEDLIAAHFECLKRLKGGDTPQSYMLEYFLTQQRELSSADILEKP